jgi:hypothetical protein
LELAEVVAGALGVARATVVQHLRNLQKEGRITFKGYGRGAARMGPADAAGLLIAAVGSDLVKHSLAALDSFGSLRLMRIGRPLSAVTFLDHLTGLLASAAADGDDGGRPQGSNVAFRLIFTADVDAKRRHPRFALSGSGSGRVAASSFVPADWDQPLRSEEDAASRLSGLVQVRIVTSDAFSAIAHCL